MHKKKMQIRFRENGSATFNYCMANGRPQRS